MTPDPLPTEKQREQLCELIHTAFLEIRLRCREGRTQQAEDLADAFHNLSKEMYGWGQFRWDAFQDMLETYEQQYEEAGRWE